MTKRDSEAERMMDSVQALVRRFALSERADVACCGITVSQGVTLEALRASGPMRQSELGRSRSYGVVYGSASYCDEQGGKCSSARKPVTPGPPPNPRPSVKRIRPAIHLGVVQLFGWRDLLSLLADRA